MLTKQAIWNLQLGFNKVYFEQKYIGNYQTKRNFCKNVIEH